MKMLTWVQGASAIRGIVVRHHSGFLLTTDVVLLDSHDSRSADRILLLCGTLSKATVRPRNKTKHAIASSVEQRLCKICAHDPRLHPNNSVRGLQGPCKREREREITMRSVLLISCTRRSKQRALSQRCRRILRYMYKLVPDPCVRGCATVATI